MDCGAGYFLHNGKCTVKCPVGTYPDSIANQCQPCHYSCKRCAGSNNDQCTLCYPDATLHNSLCVPSILLEDLNTTLWYQRVLQILYINLLILLLVALYNGWKHRGVLLDWVRRRRGREVGLTRLRYSKQRTDELVLSESELSSD
ncbi:hypothetical protein WDU94_010366 [Cyamophila willieti]